MDTKLLEMLVSINIYLQNIHVWTNRKREIRQAWGETMDLQWAWREKTK
jgi:hypothetical protein